MPKRLSPAALLLLGAASPLLGQGAEPCSAAPAMSIDSLRAVATALHPDAATAGVRDSSVAVALIFDSRCRLVNHAVVRRPWGKVSVRSIEALVPRSPDSASGAPVFAAGGVAVLRVPTRTGLQRGGAAASDPGQPWLVWGVARAAGG